MRVLQSASFRKKTKKLAPRDKRILDNQIRKILVSPGIGQEKKGDLRGVFVHKFKMPKTQHLLAYRIVGDDLELIMIGRHENYYRDLSNYLKTR